MRAVPWWQRCLAWPLALGELALGWAVGRQLVAQSLLWGDEVLWVWRWNTGSLSSGPKWLNVCLGRLQLVGPPLELQGYGERPGDRWRSQRPGLFTLSGLRRRTGIAFDDVRDIENQALEQRGWRQQWGLVVRSLLLSWVPQQPLDCPEELHLFGQRLANPSLQQAVELLARRVESSRPYRLAFLNAHCVNVLHERSDYAECLSRFDERLVDGFGLRLAGILLQQPVRDNVNGTDLFPALCRHLEQHRPGTRVFLLGAEPGVAEDVAQWMGRHHPGLEVVGTRHGFFADRQEEDQLLGLLDELRPEWLLVAMGVPLQELWIDRHRDRLPSGLTMAVGGLFDFYSGRRSRAPQWLRELGLEWLHRLALEPARMWRRYLVGNVVFLARLVRARRRSK